MGSIDGKSYVGLSIRAQFCAASLITTVGAFLY
jgi:hypothetical protein